MKRETVKQRINRIATEFTNGTRHQSYKPVLIGELEALCMAVKLEVIKQIK